MAMATPGPGTPALGPSIASDGSKPQSPAPPAATAAVLPLTKPAATNPSTATTPSTPAATTAASPVPETTPPASQQPPALPTPAATAQAEEEEEEEEEPKLKYHRLGSTVHHSVFEVLKRDSASALTVHEKFLGLGTNWGVVYLLDFNGNEIKRFAAHSATVNDVCIDETGEYIGSCSDDGKVVISGLFSGETFENAYQRPIVSVALDPDYHRKKTRSFALGGKAGQLILNAKSWFGARDSVLQGGEGAIHAVRWRGSLIAWANDIGVKIWDVPAGKRLKYLERPKGSPRPELHRANLVWEGEGAQLQLLVGWATMVRVLSVRSREVAPGEWSRTIDVAASFELEEFCSGIGSFGQDLVILAYSQSPDEFVKGKMNPDCPELRIVSRKGDEVSSDQLKIAGYEEYKATDYQLHQMPRESLYYIVSPKDIVVARPRDLDDHLGWLLERERYEEALAAGEADEKHMKDHKLVEIAEKYMAHLLQQGAIAKAAAAAPKWLGKDAALWEKWIFRFAKLKQLKAISPYIPIKNPQLSSTVYEMVLNYFLTDDYPGFLKTITEWPHTIYNIQSVINAVLERLKTSSDAYVLMDALAELYTYDKQYDKTMHIYLRLKRGNVFELITKHNLFESIRDKVLHLMNFDANEAVKLLINNTNRIPVGTVVEQLQGEEHQQLLHTYLHAIFTKDVNLASDYHEKQVTLYAKYDRKALLPFLRQSNHYPLEKAYKICEQRQLYPEMVFILSRMGNAKQALALIIEKIGDVKEAIEFVKSKNDDELWEDLISHSMSNPSFVSGLLENIGGHVDPIKLIRRIPNGMQIPHLRDRLVKIISDYNLQMSLREGCNLILKADCVDLTQKLNKSQKKGLRVDLPVRCNVCSGPISCSKRSDEASSLFVFSCTHSYHTGCIRTAIQHASKAAEAAAAAAGGASAAGGPPKRVGGGGGGDEDGKEKDRPWCVVCSSRTSSGVKDFAL